MGLILILIVIFLLFGGGGYYGYGRRLCQCVLVSAKSSASINGVLASAPNNNGPVCVDNHEAKATACRGLTIP